MKTLYISGRVVFRFFTALLLCLVSCMVLPAAEMPSISALRQSGSNVVVEVQVPAGLRMVRLESRTRLAGGAWTPRAIARLDGNGGLARFTLPNRQDIELMRVTALDAEDLPESFFQGTNDFPGALTGSGSSTLYPGNTTGMVEDTTAPNAGAGGGGSAPRTVAESDIWRVDGNRIYFFNALRGLQVIDIENPDEPSLRGTLALPAAGEQMYLIDDQVVVLLVQANCYFGSQQSQILLVSTKEPQPKVIARLALDGYLGESRIVGTALYVAAQTYQTSQDRGQTVYTYGTRLHSFDLSKPSAPRAVGTLWYPGYNSVVAATDRLFFVVNQEPGDWSRSVIHSVDITSPSGELAEYVTVRPAGIIRDKFKLDYQGTRFTCISEEVSDQRRTRLETFYLADPRSDGPISLRKEGDLKLAERESLFATRFDGDKAYIVTFLRIDPLFIVDLSNPASPRIVSELLVPGFSTFIQPLGDRLVTVGTETNRVAVSLFDVANPAKPSLLSRVLLGESYSWSESLWNEKAVSILPDEGLILVPYSGDTSGGYSSRVQLIDLSPESLKARGQIVRSMEPRRATLHRDRIYSISSRELLVVEASNRDQPEVKQALDLGWSVDRLIVKGEYLLELSDQARWWGSQTLTQLRTARASEADRALATLTLTNLPIVGATLRGDVLHLAQAPFASWGWGIYPLAAVADGAASADDTRSRAVFTTIDVRDPLHPRVLGQTAAVLPESSGSDWQPLWLSEELLVWYTRGVSGRGYWNPIGVFPGAIAADVALPYWGWGSVAKPSLVALDVTRPVSPTVRSVTHPARDNWWSATAAHAAGSLVYFGHQESDVVEDPLVPTKPGGLEPGAAVIRDPGFPYPVVRWRQKHFMDVVDFADARQPVVRDPVSLPGALQGISRQGQLLYTRDELLDPASVPTGANQLTALAYDGVSAHRVDSIPLDLHWNLPILVSGEAVFVARAEVQANNAAVGRLETWQLAMTGRWERVGSLELPAVVQSLTQRDRLLVSLDQTVRLIDASNPLALKVVGQNSEPLCWWGDISRGDGDLERGFWIPMGDYGAKLVPRNP
ncbi:MAG: beta-propeller domain-containing protein [Verrucomicrobiales bacterium]|nr:beta-propeller domain-containing protein [Verrucomicrobiales bacterium]